MKHFKDRVVAITGAGSGIGRSLALELATRGCHLALSDKDEMGLEETKSICREHTANIRTYFLDVSNREAVFLHADAVEKDFGKVNLIFNSAGVSVISKLVDIDLNDFEWLMKINFWGVVYCTQAFLPKLIAAGEGHVVNISSIFGLISMPTQGSYNASKFGIRGYTEALLQELKIDNLPVSVSCVHPGFVATNIIKNARIGIKEDVSAVNAAFDKVAFTSSDVAARKIIQGVKRNKARILVGPDSYAVEVLHRIFGSRYHKVTSAIAKRLLY